jgi:hypothetical protein
VQRLDPHRCWQLQVFRCGRDRSKGHPPWSVPYLITWCVCYKNR